MAKKQIKTEARTAFNLECRSASLDVEKRTVEAVWSIGAPVKRYNLDEGYYMEELSMNPAHIRLQRLNSGASLIDNHSQYSIENRLGAVVPNSVQINGNQGTCLIKFSTKEEAEILLQDIRSGIPLSLSVGYQVHSYERLAEEEDKIPTLRAIDWEPFELSAVCIPADAAAKTRKYESEGDMPQSNKTIQTTPKNSDDTSPMTMERGLELVQHFGGENSPINKAFLGREMKNQPNEQQFRNAMLNALADEDDRIQIRSQVSVNEMGYQRNENHILGMARGLMNRIDPTIELTGNDANYRGISMEAVMTTCLSNANISSAGLSRNDMATRAMTTSDFPILMKSFADQRLQAGYIQKQSVLKQVSRESPFQDFRPKMTKSISDMPALKKVNEDGEFEFGSFDEKDETYSAVTYGRIINLSRQLIVNDDLGAFDRIVIGQGQQAARLESELLTELVESNPPMADGRTVFHADHNNVDETGSVLNSENISIARTAMRKQKNTHGSLLDISPEYLLIPQELEYRAEQILADIAAAKAEDLNNFAGRLKLLVEPRLTDASAWYLIASPASADGLEYGNILGEQSPYFETQHGFEIDGIAFKVRSDFGAGFVDYRSWYRNSGV